MWLVAFSTFVTVTFIAWQVIASRQPTAADGPTPARIVLRDERRLDRILEQLQIPLKVQEAAAILAVATLAVIALVLAGTGDPLTGLLAGLSVPGAAFFEMRRRLGAHAKHLVEQLPDTLMMMTNSLRAGHTLSHAFQGLGQELPAPLGPEFRRVVRALQMGQSPEVALGEMRERLHSTEIDMMVQAILIQRETGGNLAEILTNIQTTLRERIKLKGKVRSLTAQGKLSGVVIGMLPFALFAFLWIANRSYIVEFLQNPIGQQLMAGALAGQLVGYLMIRRIVNFAI